MNVMLLAAGEGTRLRPYTAVLPKPAIPFLTVPLAAHALAFLRGIEINNLVVNTFYLPQKIHGLFHTLPCKSQSLYFSDELGQILGSAGGLKKAQKYFLGGGDFIMMNADEVILSQDSAILKKALEAHKKSGALATLMVTNHPGVGTQFGGVWTNEKNAVQGFGKAAFPQSTKGWHFVGVQILSEKVFDYIPESGESNILYDALTVGIQKGDLVQAYPFECSWFETGNPTDFLKASEKCLQYLFSNDSSFQKKALLNTLKEFSPEEVCFELRDSARLMYAKSAQIDASAKIQGFVIAGKNSRIEADARLKNVILAENAVAVSTDGTDLIFL